MARGNMVLTLVAQTKAWAGGLKKAAGDAVTFGSVVKGVSKAVSAAFLGIAGAVVMFLPNFIKMGEEARKSERRLQNIATQMGLFGDNTEKVTKRLSNYAETLSFATGVDDELIRANEAVLLTFKNLAKSADTLGGPFDRATQALLDLEAAGKDVNAVKLGRALEDPIKGMTGLTRAGIMFSKSEQDTIKKLVEHNDLLGAQDIILKKIEGQVGGTAAATASSTDKMAARFENVVETLSGALLPAVDTLADKFANWLDSAEGKKAIDDLRKSFEEFGAWITSPDGAQAMQDLANGMRDLGLFARDTYNFLKDVKKVLDDISKFNSSIFPKGSWTGSVFTPWNVQAPATGGNTSAPGGAPPRAQAPVTVNVTGITPTATVGKTVIDAVKNAQRLGMR